MLICLKNGKRFYKVMVKRANFKLACYNSSDRGKGVKIVGLVLGDKKRQMKY